MSGRVLVCLAVLGVLISAVIETGARRQRKYGCRFSDHLCKPSEGCVDDGVFGYCMEDGGYYAPTSMYLDEKTAKLLEKEIRRLVKRGHTWSDPYTQCILGNVLDSYEANVEYDRTLCNQDTTDNDLDSDTLNLLQKLFLDKYSTYYDRLLRKDKKQGVHKVHKYLENDPIDYNSEMYLMPQQRSGGSYMGFWEKRKESPTEQYYNDLLRHSNDNDIQELRNYLATLRKLEMYENEIDSENPGTQYGGENEFVPDSRYKFVENPEDGQYVKNDEDQYKKNDEGQYMKSDEESPWTSEPNNKNEISNEEGNGGDEVSKEEFQLHTISPDDAKVLGELLENRGNIDSLPDDQIKRLTEYVGFMLEAIERGENGFPDGRQGDGSQGDSSQGDSAIETEKETDNQTEDAKAQDAKTEDTKETETDKKSDAIPSSSKEEMPNRYIHTPHAVFNVEVKDGKNWLNEKKGMPAKKLSKSAQEMNRDAEEVTSTQNVQKDANFDRVLKNYVYIETDTANLTQEQATRVLVEVIKETGLQNNTLIDVSVSGKEVSFQVLPNAGDVTATMVANKIVEAKADLNKRISGVQITSAGIGREQHKVQIKDLAGDHRDFVLTFVICGCIAGVLIAVVAIYLIQRHTRVKEKLRELTASGDGTEASADYQDLCRQHMQSKSSEKPEPLHVASRVGSVSHSDGAQPSPTSRSSTSSWSEEPVANNMDISTGHIVLSYMEDHLKNKDRLDREWEALCAYEAEPGSTEIASQPNNQRKNRYCDIMPYDHSRVVLNDGTNVSGSDYVNANTITDHDPRNPAYITTQGPLPHTVADFWQMVWEQGSVVIVMLTKLSENGVAMCHRYWPEEGSDLYHIYEVHLVSEHIWCEDFLVRSFYLKNLQTNETRTVTQFHFLSWTDLGVPTSIKTLLDFRRKVNKSYRGRSCPIVVHCSDGCGRSGTYILIDMVLNRMSKGAKEIDIAATLEHIRDQRMGMVKTKEQFEFVLAAVAEEVHAILKALPQ